ncbi:DUF1659 domain-containing protein [Caldibacillus lycopersici]|uniref:DUF1659 domain-containing protein n=1 Tax=Perspicuibacillus lycopersici TaxID=1325689 RepID=A0AAE3LMF2_9BACI|nr:DUF1659 domain-containing protein [Perspicuibacillus lycopersici]MCU9612657.1 DUF1659 domain-containing protein [Perspicuibacillus lycopersici]
MAISNPFDTNVQLVFDAGVDGEGKPVFKKRTYSNFKTDSTPDQIYQVAQALSSLNNLPLYSVQRVDKHEIVE